MKILWIRLAESALLISLLYFQFGSLAYTMTPLQGYIVLFLICLLIADIGASLFSQKSLASSYLFNPKNRIFYISQGLLFAIPVVYCIKLWNITGILGNDTLSLFWDYLLPLNIAIAVSILLLLTLITLTSPSKNKLNFAPIIIGSIVSVLWWARIYQKCMDKSILFTSSNTVDMQIYLFYIGAAILIVLITVGVTLYTVKEHKLSV